MKCSTLLSLLLLFNTSIFAQTTTLDRIAPGEYKFAKGKVLVSLVDTVSPDFITYQMELLGFEVIESTIKPVSGWTTHNLDTQQFEMLLSHPFVDTITTRRSGITEEYIASATRGKSTRDSLMISKSLRRIMENPTKHIHFHHQVTYEDAIEFTQQYTELDITVNIFVPKSIIINTVVGKEREAMSKINDLIYVENTAFIALNN